MAAMKNAIKAGGAVLKSHDMKRTSSIPATGMLARSRPVAIKKIRSRPPNPFKLRSLREQRNLSFRIEVDGGVALDTVERIVRAGAEILVAGNAVFGNGDPKINAGNLLKAALEATLQKV